MEFDGFPSMVNCVSLFLLLFLVADVIVNKKKIHNGTVEMEVPILYHMASETQPYVKNFLNEIKHVSECSETKCTYSWCENTKKILSHASICTDIECTTCVVMRPLLFLHSVCCTTPTCLLPFCSVGVLKVVFAWADV